MEKQKYELVIFDLDGTLVDTSEGIVECYNFALHTLGVPEPYDINSIIGRQLKITFQNHFGLSENDAILATKLYREHYAEVGSEMSKLYNGIVECLLTLKASGHKLAVATLKVEKLAIPLLEKLGIGELFDVIHGVDSGDKLKKSDLINMCLKELKIKKEDAILVGDSTNDKNGAEISNIDFLPVSYGFGFNMTTTLKKMDILSLPSRQAKLLK